MLKSRIPAFFIAAICLLAVFPASAQTAERYAVMDGTSGMARIFNVSDNTQVAAIQTGPTPNSVVFSPDGRLAYVANLNGQYVSVIDMAIQAEIKRIRPVRVDQLAITADGKTIIGTDLDDESITLIDAASLSFTRTISLNGLAGDDPNSFDLFFNNPVVFGNKLFLNTSSDVVAVDLGTSAVTPLSGPADSFFFQSAENLAISPDGKLLSAIRSGGLVVISTVTNATFTTVPFDFAVSVTSGPNPLNPGQTVAYVANFNFSRPGLVVDVVDLPFGDILAEVQLPAGVPAGQQTMISLNPSGSRAFISGSNGNPNLVIMDTAAAISNPAAAIIQQSVVALQNRATAAAFTQTQPSATAPVVAGVNRTQIKNDKSANIRISGSGFAPGAMVRIGTLDPIAAQFVSSSVLTAAVPENAPSQAAAIIVTNRSLESGILSNALTITTPAQFKPPNQAAIVNFGSSTLSVADPANDRGLASLFPAGPRSTAAAISPDGSRIYITDLFQPAAVTVFNFVTNTVEAHIVINGNAVSLPGQQKGLVFAPRLSTGKPAAYVVATRRIGRAVTVDLYAIDADPASPTFNTVVDDIPTNITTASNGNGSLAMTPDGRFAFIDELDNLDGGNLVILDVATHALTSIPMTTLGASTFQPTMEVSSDGKFIVLLGDDGSFRIFDIGSNPAVPALVATVHGTVPAGATAVFLASPRIVGGHLFSMDMSDNVVNIFNFNPAASDFTELANFAVPGATALIESSGEVTPDGKLIYFPLREEDSVAVLDVDKILQHDPTALITRIGAGVAPDWVSTRPATTTLH
ncbi:MAG TPA: cytochrome D1 domain-containing protein [Candidatus Angelobacter sp.]|nr:cytochrome D1 domain-containing protein [Candidatus Angelobacter sp.]